MNEKFKDCPQINMITGRPDSEMQIQKYHVYSNNGIVSILAFELNIKLTVEVDNKIKKVIFLPIYVDVDLEHKVIYGRSKSKNKIFRYTETLITEDSYKATTKNLIIQAINMIVYRFEISLSNRDVSSVYFKNNIYRLFRASTFTPQYIEDLVNGYRNKAKTFVDNVMEDVDIGYNFYDGMLEDIDIFLEKFISISKLKKEELQSDRELYPIKTSSTDFERTKHSTISPDEEPLQCKEKFFDTKKSINISRSCDSVTFCHRRGETKYFGKKPFIISFDVADGWCIMKLPRYVEEEDIQYVLSKFINIEKL